MSGSRSLTSTEERLLVRYIRRIAPRDRAVISTQLLTGFRISEVLSLTVGQVMDADGQIRPKIGVRPRNLKGGYGGTRWIPVCPELHRALEKYLTRRARSEALRPEAPLFLSRQRSRDGQPKALSRSGAEKLIRTILRRVGQGDLETLSTHSLRKSWAAKLYRASGHDIVLVKEGLSHSSVSVTQAYLSCDRQRLDALILKGDWSRRPKTKPQPQAPLRVVAAAEAPVVVPAVPAPTATASLTMPTTADTGFLPGLETYAA